MTADKLDQLKPRWRALDDAVRSWWDADMRTAHEPDICNSGVDWTWIETISKISGRKPDAPPDSRTLLFLPFPFSPAAGNQGAFPEMFAWDSYFINLGLLAHERYDLVRGLLLNQLFMIMRHGKVLNANRTYFLTRSQPPLHPDALWRYYQVTRDREMLLLAYPLLSQEYRLYWGNADHSTPTGLTTNNDPHDPYLRSELASEAEAGLDFCPLFEGDIRRTVPLATNAQLVRYADVLGLIATELGFVDEAAEWRRKAETRARLIRELCWNEREGFFFEYDHVRGEQIPVWSLCGYWPLWAGVATEAQAQSLVKHLARFEHDRGLTFTDRIYPSPFPEFPVLQWSYPYCWPPTMTMTVAALAKGGYREEARRVGVKYLDWVVTEHEKTGKLWEKYVVVPGVAEDAVERYDAPSFHGWASGSVAAIGRIIELDK
ncbi:MAG TPA: trehalase family glycosidase [Bauldia sp.]|nr:trehalase family glycosidase [Bauldia sp.]